MIQSVHGTTSHTGSVPARHRAKQQRDLQLKELKAQLQDAIGKEDYEKAVLLRDQIRSMENEIEKEEN